MPSTVIDACRVSISLLNCKNFLAGPLIHLKDFYTLKVGKETYQVVARLKVVRQLKLMCHLHRLHNLIRPLSIHIALLIDLDPAPHPALLRRIPDRPEQEMRDRPRMRRRVPLDFDRVARGGGADGFGARHGVAAHIAGDVVGADVGDGAVGGGHADALLEAGGDAVDPELVEVLVGLDGREGKGEEKGGDVHFGGGLQGGWR